VLKAKAAKREKPDLKGLTEKEFLEVAEGLGLPPYRGRQMARWVFVRGARSFEEMTDLPKDLRPRLADRCTITHLVPEALQTSRDGTRKFLFRTPAGHPFESVLIPDSGRLTLCLSVQAGCRMGCAFCATGTLGLLEQLKAASIVEQYLAARRVAPEERITNLVFMGMGEPLDNYEEVARALRILTHPAWLAVSPRRITVSTCGLVPAMIRFKAQFPQVRLAVSLGAPDDERRNRLIPINKRYPLSVLLDACRKMPLPPRQRMTFEYCLLSGVNDSPEDAGRLAELLRGIRCKVNLIPFNEFPGIPYRRPGAAAVNQFAATLAKAGVSVTVRESRGRDIDAACGQLAGTAPSGPDPDPGVLVSPLTASPAAG
jgi:23S rRNA (adenine2503-C2)-methyltransferase